MNPEQIRKLLERIRAALSDMGVLGGEVRSRLQRAEERFLRASSATERADGSLKAGDVEGLNRNLADMMRELRGLVGEMEGIGNDGMVAGRVTRDNLAEIGLTLESAPALREARIPGLTRYRVTWTARTRQGTFAGSGEVEAATPQEAIQRMQREIPEARGGTGYRAVPAEPMEGFGAEQRPVPGGGGWGPLETQMNRAGQATGVASMKATPEHVLRVDLVTEGGRQVTAAGEVVPAREMFRWAVNAPPAKGGALLAYGETTTLSEAQTLADAATRIRK